MLNPLAQMCHIEISCANLSTNEYLRLVVVFQRDMGNLLVELKLGASGFKFKAATTVQVYFNFFWPKLIS